MDRIAKIARKIVSAADAQDRIRKIIPNCFKIVDSEKRLSILKIDCQYAADGIRNDKRTNFTLWCETKDPSKITCQFDPCGFLKANFGLREERPMDLSHTEQFLDNLVQIFNSNSRKLKELLDGKVSLDADSILSDVNSTMRGGGFESASIKNKTLYLQYFGKAYGDGYDFNESYRNGRFAGGSCSDKWHKLPFFEKEAKYIYGKYKIADIVISGGFD